MQPENQKIGLTNEQIAEYGRNAIAGCIANENFMEGFKRQQPKLSEVTPMINIHRE